MRNLGLLLLGIWLLATGILTLLRIDIPQIPLVLTGVAIVSGALLVIDGLRSGQGLPRNVGVILLGLWLILVGLPPFINIPSSEIIVAIVGIIAGVVILLRR